MAITERDIIKSILAPLASRAEGAFGLTDDVALIPSEPGFDHVVTLDTLVEGVHFRGADAGALVAKKALRVNISDLVAKGAEPFAWFMSLALSPGADPEWLKEFAAGLAEDQIEFRLALYGGDTVRSPSGLAISITMMGRCPEGDLVRRSGGRAGDALYVSGTIGDGALGLRAAGHGGSWGLDAAEIGWLENRFLVPQPRIAMTKPLRVNASAAMDISDGLVNDLRLLCGASGVGADIEIGRVPLSAPARRAVEKEPGLLSLALSGGDDYEFLAAIPRQNVAAFEAGAKAAGVAVVTIGNLTGDENQVNFLDANGQRVEFADQTFRHM